MSPPAPPPRIQRQFERQLGILVVTERSTCLVNPYRHITPTTEQGVLILSVELDEVKDYIRAEELKYELSHAVRGAKTNQVVLDLHKMEFMTSLACVAFIGVKHAVRERQGRLILCNMSEFIHKVLSAKRLLSPSQANGHVAFEQAPTLKAAIAMLNSPPPGSVADSEG